MNRFYALVIFVLVACVGCSSDGNKSSVFAMTSSYFAPREFAPELRFAQLFDQARPVLDIEFVDLGVAGKLVLEQQDGQYSRYLSADLGGIVLQNGVVHSMFGFGEPLAGAELSEPLRLILAGQSGQADRFHTYIDGENRAVTRTFYCQITALGSRDVVLENRQVVTKLLTESCQGLNQSFENIYFVDILGGEVVQSRQWVGENVGSIATRVTQPYE